MGEREGEREVEAGRREEGGGGEERAERRGLTCWFLVSCCCSRRHFEDGWEMKNVRKRAVKNVRFLPQP